MKRVLHYEPMSKHQNMEWKQISFSRTKKLKKMCLLLAKWCWCCFGTSMDPSSALQGSWTDSQYTMVEEDLQPTIHGKHRGMLTSEVVLHHDNSWPQMAAATTETIQKLKSKLLPTQHTVQILPHLITIFLTAKRCIMWMPSCNWWKDQGCGAHVALHTNQKHSLQMASGSSWTKVTNAWRSKEIMLKNDSIFVLVYLL